MSKKKIGIVLGIFLAAMFLSGCGAKKADNDKSGQKNQKTEVGKNVSAEKLPEATGKVDDTVNAIIEGADKENAQAVGDDSDAKAATDDSQEADDFGKAYDESQLQ